MGRVCLPHLFFLRDLVPKTLGRIRKINQTRSIPAPMVSRTNKVPNHYGYGEHGISRYLLIYFAQIVWFVLGVGLFWGSMWPSTCTPDNVIKLYSCSMLLPDSGGLRELALLTWLWATPMLIVMEIARRLGGSKD